MKRQDETSSSAEDSDESDSEGEAEHESSGSDNFINAIKVKEGWRYVYTPFDYIDTLYNTNQAREYYVDTLCYCIDTLSG